MSAEDKLYDAFRMAKLLEKHAKKESLTPDEQVDINRWLAAREGNRELFARISNENQLALDLLELQDADTERELVKIDRKLRHIPVKQKWKWVWYGAAALVIILSIGLSLYWYQADNQEAADFTQHKHIRDDVPPGGNRATLILADGRSIDLSESQSGIVLGQELTYEDGSLVLDDGAISGGEQLIMKIPKGGTYRITLPDGTKVWLNAESVLQYPSQFKGRERLVNLSGEAYFDVAKDKKRPFRVGTAEQVLEVLGTQFNITAYDNELATKTTLVEGNVKVTNLKVGADNMLKPGQQSIVIGGDTKIKEVSTEQFSAWKDGFFSFDSTPFPEVLEQLARWYDIEIEYRKKPSKTFSGKMKRSAQLASVLDFFEGSGITFHLEGRRLIIG